MGTPWTPGPWVISGKGSIRGPNAPRQILGYIARVNWQNREANARLIAEAPAMAEALEQIEQMIDYGQYSAAQRIIETILTRIRGESAP